jgi:DNA-binding CsgD family transcriptional regulator
MLRDILIQKGLSNREAEVAELVSKGLSNKLFVTEKTVKFHLTNIYKKMNLRSRAQLIVWCLPHLGFVENDNRREVNAAPARETQQTPITAATTAFAAQPATMILPAQNRIDGGNTNNGDMGAGI